MSTSKPTLLVVDPDPSRCRAASRAWSKSFRVVTAGDAVEAFDAMKSATPAIVLAEWSLPDIDGTMFERVVRASTTLCAVPIIFTLGWKSRERVVHQIVGCGLLDALDDRSFSTLVRGVTAMTRGTSRGSGRAPRSPKPAAPAPSSGTRDPEDGRAYLVRRLAIA